MNLVTVIKGNDGKWYFPGEMPGRDLWIPSNAMTVPEDDPRAKEAEGNR